jgi:hypothetical protein
MGKVATPLVPITPNRMFGKFQFCLLRLSRPVGAGKASTSSNRPNQQSNKIHFSCFFALSS